MEAGPGGAATAVILIAQSLSEFDVQWDADVLLLTLPLPIPTGPVAILFDGRPTMSTSILRLFPVRVLLEATSKLDSNAKGSDVEAKVPLIVVGRGGRFFLLSKEVGCSPRLIPTPAEVSIFDRLVFADATPVDVSVGPTFSAHSDDVVDAIGSFVVASGLVFLLKD